MATEIAEDPLAEELEVQPEQAEQKKGSFFSSRKVKVLVLLVLVMGVESAGFFLLVPQASKSSTGGGDDPSEFDEVDTLEISLDKINGLVNQIAEPGVSTDVSFNLIVVVATSQETAFNQAWKSRKGDVRQDVEKIILGASSEELRDPAREVVIRRVRESINKTLRKSYVKRVILTHWSVSSR
jgi:flagellar basal body-associated protein FliL